MAPTAQSHEAQPTQAPALVMERPLGYREMSRSAATASGLTPSSQRGWAAGHSTEPGVAPTPAPALVDSAEILD